MKDGFDLQKMMNNASRDGYKQLVTLIKEQEKQIEALHKIINGLTLEKEYTTQVDAKILKTLLRKRDE